MLFLVYFGSLRKYIFLFRISFFTDCESDRNETVNVESFGDREAEESLSQPSQEK